MKVEEVIKRIQKKYPSAIIAPATDVMVREYMEKIRDKSKK